MWSQWMRRVLVWANSRETSVNRGLYRASGRYFLREEVLQSLEDVKLCCVVSQVDATA